MRILIAADDATSRLVLTGVLQKFGHEVVATVNGTEAWEAMQRPDAPPLAILDWMMPASPGWRSSAAFEASSPTNPRISSS